jgi:large subunit ribosomal protein L24
MANNGKIKLKRDDHVMVMSGKERGKSGKILQIDRKNGKAVVQQLNMVKKAVKQKKQGEKGGIIEIEAPLNVSNLQLVCRKCGPTRAGYTFENGEKKRICKKCGEAV